MNDYKDFLESENWKNKRNKFIFITGSRCQKCNKEMSKRDLELHHKNYEEELGKEENEDLMLLCKDCHDELHQDLDFFDNPELKKRCIECNKIMVQINNQKMQCLDCGIVLENK